MNWRIQHGQGPEIKQGNEEETFADVEGKKVGQAGEEEFRGCHPHGCQEFISLVRDGCGRACPLLQM
jgi:hypothetical protein